MNNQEILFKAIHKATANGYVLDLDGLTLENIKVDGKWIRDKELIGQESAVSTVNDIIFNHDFAKALWGDKPGIGAIPGYIDDAPNWKYNLMLMVLAENPVKYLGENLQS